MSTVCEKCGAEVENGAICARCAADSALAEPLLKPNIDISIPDVDSPLRGIGGWLILVGIALISIPLQHVYSLVHYILPLLTSDRYAFMFLRYPALKPLVMCELIVSLVFLAYMVMLNVLFYRKMRPFPYLYIVYISMSLIFGVVDHLGTQAVLHNSSPKLVIQMFIFACIWIPYLLLSQRVKLTFIN